MRNGRDGVFQRKDRPGWYASYVDASGKRHKERITAHTRTQAVEALHGLKQKAQREYITGYREASDVSTADFLKRYMRYQKPLVAATTFSRLGGLLETLKRRLPTELREISKRTVGEYIAERAGEVAPGTVAKEIATLKHALGLAAGDWGLLPSNPAERAKLPKLPQGRTRYLSPTELRAVMEAAPEWMRAPIALAAFTGMRRGEILNLRWIDVDLAGRRLYLPETKNGTLRVLALNDLALQVLESLPVGPPGDLVLPGVDPARLTVYTRRIFSRLKIEGASFHSLRHTAASWLVMSGVDLFAVGQVLGHKTPRMTARYSHLSPQYMAGAMSKLDAVFSGTIPEKRGLLGD